MVAKKRALRGAPKCATEGCENYVRRNGKHWRKRCSGCLKRAETERSRAEGRVCRMADCERPVMQRRAFCYLHVARRAPVGEPKRCQVEGCERLVQMQSGIKERGWGRMCSAHSYRLRHMGDVYAEIPVGAYVLSSRGRLSVSTVGSLVRSGVMVLTEDGRPIQVRDLVNEQTRGVEG